MSYQRITLQFDGPVAVLSFNHPEVLNAIGQVMLSELSRAVREVADPANGARCLLLTGQGRAFCAGANLADDAPQPPGNRPGDVLRLAYHPLLMELRDLEMPMVSAVQGAAAGVGMSLAIMADMVCAARSAYFLQAFGRIGLVPDGGATYLLPRLVGWRRAVELSMMAEKLPADKALEWGLISRMYDDEAALQAGALGIARQLANGPRSLALMRRAYWESPTNSYEQQLDLEARLQRQAGQTDDFREGVGAFLAKRPSQFKGR